MKDLFTEMQTKTGCSYISDLPYHKELVWHEMNKMPMNSYDIKQLEDFSKYVFNVNWGILQMMMKPRKGE